MARERRGFIVSQVRAVVEYTNAAGLPKKITLAAKLQADNPHTLTESQKQKLRAKHAEKLLRETIAELKSQGITKCKGWIETKHYARVSHTDDQGKRREVWRAADSRTHANELRKHVLRDLDDRGSKALDASRMKFNDLASYFEKHYLKPAEYVDGRKIEGVRSLVPALAAVNVLRKHFGHRRLQTITYSEIRSYRGARLKEPTRGDVARHKRELSSNPKAEIKVTRTIASVNRELSKLRRMFNIALREGWVRSNPFAAGESLISLADERKRERILTRDEERRLLEACGDRTFVYERREHVRQGVRIPGRQITAVNSARNRDYLRVLIIMAIDTGMRRGEMLALTWSDIDFDAGVITVRAFNTKTMRERQLAMTTRLHEQLRTVWEQSTKDPDVRVFGILDNVKRSFTSVRKAAGLLDVRFHDLRHTHATRLVGAHIPLSEVGRVLGHTQANTTYRYVNANVETARRAAAALDLFNADGEATPVSDVVN